MRFVLILAFAVLWSISSAGASEISFSTVILDMEGKPIVDQGVETTLGKYVIAALLAVYQDEPNLAGEEKVKRFVIASKIQSAAGTPGQKVDLTVDEIALVKKLCGKAFAPMVVGRLWALLDPASVPK